MICARKSLVRGMQLLYFKLRRDGPYTVTLQPNKNRVRKEKKEKIAQSRLMIVACQMRYWRFGVDPTRGGGDNLLVLMTVHLNNLTAKKDI